MNNAIERLFFKHTLTDRARWRDMLANMSNLQVKPIDLDRFHSHDSMRFRDPNGQVREYSFFKDLERTDEGPIWGSMTRIRHKKKYISNGYHSFELIQVDSGSGKETIGVIGKTGSSKYLLGFPSGNNPMFKELTPGYHDFVVKDGVLYGKSASHLTKIHVL